MLPSEPRDVEWSADGTTVTFPWDEKGAGVENIFRQRLDGGDPTIVTHFVDGKILDHAVPKDGRHILLARRTDHDNVWITATDGSNPVALTNFESGLVESVDWLPPDERRVLFNYAEESRDAVLIRNLQGSW
jgi:Tol biopolymer transport system component